MKWVDQIPESLGKKPNPSLVGPHAAGKTECLIQTVIAMDQPTLVIVSWPWEIPRWKTALKGRKRIIVHTPESLARAIMEKWEGWAQKKLHWEVHTKIVGVDPESQAQNLLNEKTVTLDTAHWLLRDSLPELLHWKKPIDLLALDNPQEWDPDAIAWIDTLPHKNRIETRFANGPVWLPGKTDTPKEWRWLKADPTSEGAGQWVIRKVENNPGKRQILIIQSEKEKWDDYLKARGIHLEIRRAAECEGRFWDQALIPNLRHNWGGPSIAAKWLDLVASRCNQECLYRMHPDENPTWIPKNPKEKPYLIWNPEI